MSKALTITLAQINPIVGDLEGNLKKIRNIRDSVPANSNLIILPELALTGYMPEDLLIKPSFMADVQSYVQILLDESRGHTAALLLTTPYFDKEQNKLFNAFHLIHQGHILATRLKSNLPNYGPFDEKRYFSPGGLPAPVTFMGIKLGLIICEDMWFPEAAKNIKEQGAEILIVTNASPYEFGKYERRLQTARKRVADTGLPLVYLNQVGGQDDLVFDGASFILSETGEAIFQAREFVEEIRHVTMGERDISGNWLFEVEEKHGILDEPGSLYHAATLGLRDYIEKNNIGGVLLGLSGGIDSALAATIAVDAIGADRVRAVMMPSPYTSQQSLDDAAACAKSLGIGYETISIGNLMSGFENAVSDMSDLAHQNMQSRLRGMILMALSNNTSNWIVLSTGNKSEVATGYATLYGDMCGGFNPLKDIYKTQVFKMAEWRNGNIPYAGLGPGGVVIPQSIISKPPSAELKPDQVDQDTLPPYDILDEILKGLIEEDLGPKDLQARGFAPETIAKVQKLLDLAEYKRRQAPPGPKVSARAFVRDRRYPITNGFRKNHRIENL